MHDDAHAQRRRAMVERQLRARGITDERVLGAMAAVPRERFVDPGTEDDAYEDGPLPIGCAQTISQPYVVALMLELAEIGPDERVLEVGAGSGYVAALMGRLAREVVAVEHHGELAEQARGRLAALGVDNVRVVVADGKRGCPEAAPFDAIVVSAAATEVPAPLTEQLAPGGRLVLPRGGAGFQLLMRIVKHADGRLEESEHGGVAFVPLTSQ